MYVCNKITVQMMVYNLDTKPFWRSEVDEIDKVDDISKQLPWFLECNPDRYPYWWAFLRFKINIVMLVEKVFLQVWEARPKERPAGSCDA